MKKTFTLCLLLAITLSSFSQFIKSVNYRGAFAPAPVPMWTDGWTNWDPQTTAYAAATVTVTGHITANTTWTRNTVYLLSGVVYVDSLITLTIEPGTVIRGNNAVANSALLVRRGGKLLAEGTACNPIVFTSNVAAGSRNKGDWGGVILLGRAKNNLTGGVGYIEGLTQVADNAHGGTDDADNSGILKYVRIEFGGYVFAPNSEINGLTLGSVGAGTTIDNVQVSFSNDDSFEWFGGNVNCSHLVAYRGLDDDFDTDNGFSGKVQFGLGVKDPTIADNPAVSTSEGFESDNDAGSSVNTPQTSAVFSNMTMIGAYRGNSASVVAPGFKRGARLRRNTALKIFNSIFMDFATGLFIDGTAAKVNGYNGVLKYQNNIVALAPPAAVGTQRVAEDDSTRAIFFNPANSNDSLGTSAGLLITPYNFTAPDYRPAPNSPALSNYSFADQALPVTLANFSGETIKNDNFLYWETATEINNTGFEIQRSVNGQSYSSIGFVTTRAVNGNSTSNLKYIFIDKNVQDGDSYYRLNQIDKDGKSSLSNVIVLSKTTPDKLSLSVVYPNPVRDNNLNLLIASPLQQDVTVVINDASGRKVFQNKSLLVKGKNNYQLNVQSIAAGNYFVTIIPSDGSANQVKKFIKQ